MWYRVVPTKIFNTKICHTKVSLQKNFQIYGFLASGSATEKLWADRTLWLAINYIYHIAGNFGEVFNLAIWRIR